MANILIIQTNRRTSAKRFFYNGKRISKRDADYAMNDCNLVIIYR